ncbi:TetR/AcrR family transcriptional regulator [Sulfurospirillum halorespirans]|uniref:TetR family transcriptional regulator n=1 Tax=Sulfurospirillum halorespirans DSM 13726 TaxID=1193502 RepID=A0A1D7THB6_9BACT|nr:TetR/AcrR family transcriptional regulator [Sulfurospirillum halorespirans]AOO64399.1 TetR family transcriptional regulator [Sulfurospirillum halorespirans DSM 13726]
MKTKTEEKRQAIIAVATQVFIELGFDKTSMSEISNRLGGSKATLYNYFKSKEELFLETLQIVIEAEFQMVHKALDPYTDDISKSLYTFGEKFLNFIYSDSLKEVRKLAITESGKTELGKITYTKGARRSYEMIAVCLNEAMQLNKLHMNDPLVAAQHLLALLEAETLMPFLMNVKTQITEPEIKAISKRAIDVFMRAYGI